jgi:hypothetical protein
MYTPTQKVLLCLVDRKKKDAMAIHVCSKVAYATVLKTLDELETNSMVTCTPGKPRIYQLQESVTPQDITAYLTEVAAVKKLPTEDNTIPRKKLDFVFSAKKKT